MGRHVQLEGRHRNVALRERPEVGAFLVLHARRFVTANPIVGFAARILAGDEFVTVDTGSLAGDPYPGDLLLGQIGEVDVEERIGR